MNRSLLFVLPLVTLAVCAGNARGQIVTSNGSTICDSSRVALVAIDANYKLPSNTDKIIYAAGVNDTGACRIRIGHGGHTLQFRILAGLWADVPTANASGPHLAATGTVLVNNTTVSDTERRANSGGIGIYAVSAKQFTSSTNLDFPVGAEIRNNHGEGQWALDFSNCPNRVSYEFRVGWGTKDCGYQYVNYPAQIRTPGIRIVSWQEVEPQ